MSDKPDKKDKKDELDEFLSTMAGIAPDEMNTPERFMEATELLISAQSSAVSDLESSDLAADYKRVRDVNYAMQTTIVNVINGALKLLTESANPRMFGAVDKLANTLITLNKSMLESSQQYEEVRGKYKENNTEADPNESITDKNGVTALTINALVLKCQQKGITNMDDILDIVKVASGQDAGSEKVVNPPKVIENDKRSSSEESS